MPILKIKELRENHGMTQMQVAQKLDIPLSTYRSYETGVREPGVNMLITLSELYGVTTDYLLNYSQKPTALNSDEIKHIKNTMLSIVTVKNLWILLLISNTINWLSKRTPTQSLIILQKVIYTMQTMIRK